MVMDHPIVEAIARTEGRRIDGIIGYNIFGRYRMVIDYQNKKLTFVPSENRPTEMMALMMTLMFPSLDELEKTPLVNPKSLLGFQVEKKGSGPGVVVAKVFDGGPAARAGMKAGDRLLTLDGRWTDRVLDCHDAMSEVSPGRAVSAEIERDGKRLKLTLQPVAGI
jgi:predicted metalloprotease with PDZ domain